MTPFSAGSTVKPRAGNSSVTRFTNKRLLAALSGSIIAMMLAIYWLPMQVVFKTAPLGFNAWIRILLVSSTVVITAEILKITLLNKRIAG